MKLTIDMETRSKVDLKEHGVYVYAKDPSTDILCIAIKVDGDEPKLWVPDGFRFLADLGDDLPLVGDDWFQNTLNAASVIEAHNYNFEHTLWQEIMTNRYEFDPLDINKGQCSAAKAAAHALPRSLDKACSALGLAQQKDKVGYRLMLKMCKPRKPTKLSTKEWHEDPDDFIRLCKYCMQDVEAEYALSQALNDLSEAEQKVWVLDQKINDRGVHIDIPSAQKLIDKVQKKERELLLEIQELTCGRVKSVRQTAATLGWLKDNDVEMDNLQKGTVIEIMKDLPESKAKRILEIRQSLGKSSTTKLDAMIRFACDDQRARGTTIYHGASTGRWTGKGIQVHNLIRESFSEKEVDFMVDGNTELIELLYGCIIQNASKCVRGMITAPEGRLLACADFSAIEARVLAWIAGETKTLEAFRNGLDVYKVTAADIYKSKYEQITKAQRQIGKVAVLALGYQGWLGAFQVMGKGYGVEIDEDEATTIIKQWREANKATCNLWAGVEEAAINAVKTGKPFSYGRIKFGIRGKFLHCRLPSGRLLSYYNPKVETVKTKFGVTKEAISFWGVGSFPGKTVLTWMKQFTYGGKLTENIVQATARDVLVNGMFNLDKAGFDIVMHVHDEVVAEVDKDFKDIKEFEKLLTIVPSWATGLPLAAEGWIGKRYRK